MSKSILNIGIQQLKGYLVGKDIFIKQKEDIYKTFIKDTFIKL